MGKIKGMPVSVMRVTVLTVLGYFIYYLSGAAKLGAIVGHSGANQGKRRVQRRGGASLLCL